jgi:hypothetical protein
MRSPTKAGALLMANGLQSSKEMKPLVVEMLLLCISAGGTLAVTQIRGTGNI